MSRENREKAPNQEQERAVYEQKYEESRKEERKERRVGFIERYEKEAEISKETKKQGGSFLEREREETEVNYLTKEWWGQKENQKRIKENGFDPENESEGYRIRIANKLEALEDLEENEKYSKTKEKINDVDEVKSDFQGEKPSMDAQLSTLTILHGRMERIGDKIQEEKDDSKKVALKNEFNELFKITKELAEKNTGKNFVKEGEEKSLKEIKLEAENDFINKRVEDRMKDIEERGLLAHFNYKKGEMGFFRTKIALKDEKGNFINDEKGKIKNFKNLEEIDEFLKKKANIDVSKAVKTEYNKEKIDKEDQRKNFKEQYVKDQIKFVAEAPGNVIKERIKIIKEGRLDEFIKDFKEKEQEAKKQPKGLKKEKVESKGEKGGPTDLADLIDIFEKIKLTGKPEKDVRNGLRMLKRMNLFGEIDDKELMERWKKMENEGINYEEVKSKGGFLMLLIKLLLGISE